MYAGHRSGTRAVVVKLVTRAATALLLAVLCACQPPADTPRQPAAPLPVQAEVAAVAEQAGADVVAAVAPTIAAARTVVDDLVPPPPVVEPTAADAVHPDAVALLVRYEVTSPEWYARRLQGVICPGLQSGPTWGVGYDGGHQTSAAIAADWHEHPDVQRLAEAAGRIGAAECRSWLAYVADVRTPFSAAQKVFAASTLPKYRALAARTFREGWTALHPIAQGVLVVIVYNRGAAMAGERRREMRALRDVCVPAADYACMRREILAMPRLWVGTPEEAGLRNRYVATAALLVRIGSA